MFFTAAALDSVFFVVTEVFNWVEPGFAGLFDMDFSVGPGAGLAADFAVRPDAVVSAWLAAFDETLSIDFAAAVPVPALTRPVAGVLAAAALELLAEAAWDRAGSVFFATEAWVFAVFFIALAMRLTAE
ncbi:hypothetical protein [Lacisediminimonas profundi]|uniref:hypothetical protein n=1 Tax=Lacisediminimonas profundi TaxID=2603856 RepID=UPI001F500B67|nr:hypothetical protein [Lacisediminimonas profundi]